MKNLVRLLLCVSLSAFAVARAVSSKTATATATTQKKTTGQKADAKTLLHDAKKAAAAIIKNARADKALDPKKPKNKPFWKSVHLVAKNLKTAETGLAAKSNDFFKGIANAREAEEQLKVDWQLTDSKKRRRSLRRSKPSKKICWRRSKNWKAKRKRTRRSRKAWPNLKNRRTTS